jgi:hypothetical protein
MELLLETATFIGVMTSASYTSKEPNPLAVSDIRFGPTLSLLQTQLEGHAMLRPTSDAS